MPTTLCVFLGWQDLSSENTTSENQRSSASIGTGELQPQQESQELSEVLQQEQSGNDNMHMNAHTK